jgi:hypothetical protein
MLLKTDALVGIYCSILRTQQPTLPGATSTTIARIGASRSPSNRSTRVGTPAAEFRAQSAPTLRHSCWATKIEYQLHGVMRNFAFQRETLECRSKRFLLA